MKIHTARSFPFVILSALGACVAVFSADGAPSARNAIEPTAQARTGDLVVDGNLPRYEPSKESLKAKLRVAGSSTVSVLLDRAGDGFKRVAPDVSFDIKGEGSSAGIAALLGGTADLVGLSRQLSAKERSDFQAKFSYPPTELIVGFDPVAVYVRKDNPIDSMTLADVSAVFGAAPSAGRSSAKVWGDFGLAGDFATLPLSVFGFRSESSHANPLKESVLAGGSFRSELQMQMTPGAIVTAVSGTKGGVGYLSPHPTYASASTKTVPLARADGQGAVAPTQATVSDGTYPLNLPMYVYINRKPATAVPAPTREFLTFVLSKEGQDIAAGQRWFSIPASLAQQQLAKLK
ncbi:MAG: substrate-binding domain-containing protein [Phycisphaerae bacterium]|nr:substrate-binding domain-containing protein [Phycisphaerae bacterium]